MSLFDEFNKDESNSPVQSKGPAVLLPAEAIGNVVTKTNTLILEHRDWLANLPRRKERIKRQSDEISPPRSLITPAPSLKHSAINPFVPRQNLVLPECNSISSSAFSAGVIAGAASASTQLQSSILSAQSAFASAQLSAAIALSTASVSAQATANVQIISVSVSVSSSVSASASSAISVAQASASSAVASAKASASSVVLAAQSSANAVVLSATNALSSVQASASSAVSSASGAVVSANSAAADARASASLAIQSAMASVTSAQQSASATKVAAMNETVLALTITFSIIGSSLITILIIYLITRCRRNRRERKQSELKERIHRLRHESDESMAPSLSAFPLPGGRKNWITRSRPNTVETAEITGTGTGMLSGSPTLLNSGPLQGSATRQTWAPTREARERGGQPSQSDMDFGFSGAGGSGSNPNQGQKDTRKTWAAREAIPEERPTGMVRKNTLTYDPEHPDRPPKFTTWLEESFRSVSPFPNIENDERFSGTMGKGKQRMSSYLGQKKQSLMQRRRSRSMGEVSDIGTAI